jgi:hypothetical protein
MKRFVVVIALLSVVLLSLFLAPLTVAETEGPSANGSFRVSVGSGVSRDIQFEARLAKDGSTTGEINFQDDGALPTTARNTADAEPGGEARAFYARASCDCLVIKGVEAVLGGTIMESSHKNWIGRRVVLVVQDGDSLDPPLRDKLTFGFYRKNTKSWLASDAERPDEQGPAPTWVATDAERNDDTGVLSIKNEEVTCESFPISSYSFITAKEGKGKIQVTR